jgi:hypothetical protein
MLRYRLWHLLAAVLAAAAALTLWPRPDGGRRRAEMAARAYLARLYDAATADYDRDSAEHCPGEWVFLFRARAGRGPDRPDLVHLAVPDTGDEPYLLRVSGARH